jgi:hypothetical protein
MQVRRLVAVCLLAWLTGCAGMHAGNEREVAHPPPAADACPIPGELIQWQADYCMQEIGTDDVIAAQPCLEREERTQFRSQCDGKFHYKGAMCARAIDADARSGTVDACVADPGFQGLTVRDGGT